MLFAYLRQVNLNFIQILLIDFVESAPDASHRSFRFVGDPGGKHQQKLIF